MADGLEREKLQLERERLEGELRIREQELELRRQIQQVLRQDRGGHSAAQIPDDVRTLGELSLKYYGEKKYCRLIVWVNRKDFDGSVSIDTLVPRQNRRLFVLQFIP